MCPIRCPSIRESFPHGPQEIRTLLLPLAKLRRTARRHGCQPVQGLRPGAAVREVRQRQVRRPALRAHHHPAGRQLRRHGGAQGQERHRRPDQQEDPRAAGRGQQAVRHAGLQRRHQARQRQGDGGPAHQPDRHLREPGARLLEEPRRRRRHPRRRLRIPDAALRHRERQEQGPVLHAGRGQPHHGQDPRHRQRQDHQRHHGVRPHLRLGLAAAQGGRRGHRQGHALRAGEGLRHRRPGAHEHDPARQPHGAASSRATRWPTRCSPTPPASSRPSTTSSPIRPSATNAGAPASTRPTTRTSASSTTARRPPSRATTPTCCTSCARSRAPARAPASCRTACCSAAMPRA